MPEETLPTPPITTPSQDSIIAPAPPVLNPFASLGDASQGKNKKTPSQGKSPVLKFILLGILFIFGLSLMVGAYLMGINKSKTPEPIATASPTPTLSEDISSNWQTMLGNNFTFKYPNDWQKTNTSPGGLTNGTIGLEQIESDKQEGTAPPIMGTYFDNPNNLSLIDWEEQTQKTDRGLRGYYIADAKVTKSGENTYFSSSKGNCEPFYCDQVVIVSDKKIFIFQHLGLLKTDLSQDRNIYKDTFNEIVSSFKFADSTSDSSTDTSDWKTYTNSDFGISIEIPSNYAVLTQLPTKIVLGIKQGGDSEPIITLNKTYETSYQSFPLCSKSPNTFPCKETEVISTTIDKKNVDIVRISNGADSLDELISIPDPENTKIKEIKMSVAGGGLPAIFDHLKNTLQFN